MHGIDRLRHLEGKRDRDRDSVDRSVRRVVIRYADGGSLAIEPDHTVGLPSEDDAIGIADLFDKGSAGM